MMSSHNDSFVFSGSSPTPIADIRPENFATEQEFRFVLNLFLDDLCQRVGVRFRGVQPKLVEKHDELVLFDAPNGSTLAVPLIGFSAQAILQRLARYQAETEQRTEVIASRGHANLDAARLSRARTFQCVYTNLTASLGSGSFSNLLRKVRDLRRREVL